MVVLGTSMALLSSNAENNEINADGLRQTSAERLLPPNFHPVQ